MNANAMHSPPIATRNDTVAAHRLLALMAINVARAELACIANATDTPNWHDVETADLLDAAHAQLARSVST